MKKRRATLLIDAGIWLRLAGDEEGARKLFEQALTLDPDNQQAAQLVVATSGAEAPRVAPKAQGAAPAPAPAPAPASAQGQAQGQSPPPSAAPSAPRAKPAPRVLPRGEATSPARRAEAPRPRPETPRADRPAIADASFDRADRTVVMGVQAVQGLQGLQRAQSPEAPRADRTVAVGVPGVEVPRVDRTEPAGIPGVGVELPRVDRTVAAGVEGVGGAGGAERDEATVDRTVVRGLPPVGDGSRSEVLAPPRVSAAEGVPPPVATMWPISSERIQPIAAPELETIVLPPTSLPTEPVQGMSRSEAIVEYLRETDAYLRYGIYERALELAALVLAEDPENAEAYEKAKRALFASKGSAAAFEQLLKVLRVYAARLDAERAGPFLDELLAQQPGHPEVPVFLSVLRPYELELGAGEVPALIDQAVLDYLESTFHAALDGDPLETLPPDATIPAGLWLPPELRGAPSEPNDATLLSARRGAQEALAPGAPGIPAVTLAPPRGPEVGSAPEPPVPPGLEARRGRVQSPLENAPRSSAPVAPSEPRVGEGTIILTPAQVVHTGPHENDEAAPLPPFRRPKKRR